MTYVCYFVFVFLYLLLFFIYIFMFMQLIDSTYHSIIFLLPDCTILIMAQGNCQFMKNDVSLFEKINCEVDL